jgi:hypothetical protein
MPELRSHKRGRSLDQRLFGNSEHRFITASGEAEAEATASDSEYDSDVIVGERGENAPEFHERHPIIRHRGCAPCHYPLHHRRM